MNNPELEHELQKEALWMEGQATMDVLKEKGAQEYFDSLQGHEHLAEEDAELPCACIDERIGGHKFALPGSGILESPDVAFSILKEAGVDSISSHEDCGAANLAFERLDEDEKQRYGSADAYAQAWAKDMADRLGVLYVGHKTVETPGQHIARAIYYDSSGRFTADAPGVPKGFTISRKFGTPETAQSSLGLAIKIATGEHAFKDKYSPENPLVIVPIGEEGALDVLREEIQKVVEQNPELAGVIKIDQGYQISEEQEEKAA